MLFLSTWSKRVSLILLECENHLFIENIEWLDPTKTRCHIYWRRPEEWGSLIYEWALSSGLLNTPCTLYEVAYGDDTTEECESLYKCFNQIII